MEWLSIGYKACAFIKGGSAAMHLLLVDGQPARLDALGALVKGSFAGAGVVASSDLGEALEKARWAPPLDLGILDPDLPGCSGNDALRCLRREFPGLRVLVISEDDDRSRVAEALRAGASGYALRTLKMHELAAVIRFVAEGGRYVPPQLLEDDAASPPAPEPAHRRVTERQREVLRLAAKGYCNKKIARALAISEGTVKQHMHDVCSMLGVSSRFEAIGAAIRLGMQLD
jgi:two-component system nitrate/nitrite response regulator NarL